MRWFGKKYDAPAYETCHEVPVPVGESCMDCSQDFSADSDGFAMPFVDADTVGTAYYHRACLLKSFGLSSMES